MVASLVPAAAMGKEYGYTVVVVVAKTAAVGTAGDCPSTIVEDDVVVLWVGYTPCGTSEEHR
jgi:hypothetical protein